jgi:hypothetical protein
VSAWPANPVVHEINTWVWLEELSRTFGRRITLADVPAEVWDDVARPGVDAVWLMGVWERSPRGAQIAREHHDMRRAAEEALPGMTDSDIVGSAYCVRRYSADPFFGGDLGLAMARVALAHRDVKLVLDLVPNHVAPDHDWTVRRPELFVHATFEQARDEPGSCIEVQGHMLACGRDPYFPAWPEVVQLDATSPALRAAMVEQVMHLAERCDAVRCDMAMLMLDDVFVRTWGDRARPDRTDGRGYWPTIIEPVKAAFPDFQFWAEAYWDLEPVLLEQGFDACYDKRLYDTLVHAGSAADVRAHVADGDGRGVRFVENHDEPRAASLVGPQHHRALLTAVCTLPGVALLHEGGAQGRRTRVPVILRRRPDEQPDHDLERFVHRLLAALGDDLRRGEWALATIDGWPDNRTNEQLLAWTWTSADARYVVVVNLSDQRADGMLAAPWDDVAGDVTLIDRLSAVQFERSGGDWIEHGLYVALEPYGVHLFDVRT